MVERREGGVGLIVSRQEQDQAAVRAGAVRIETDRLPELGDAFLELFERVVGHRELEAEVRVVGINRRERAQAVAALLVPPVDGEGLRRDKELLAIGDAIPEAKGGVVLRPPLGVVAGDVEVGPELEMGHREIGIELQRGEQLRVDRIDVAPRPRLDRFGVLLQRRERPRRHRLQRLRRRLDRIHRLAKVLPEIARQFIEAGEQLLRFLILDGADEEEPARARFDHADANLCRVPAPAHRSGDEGRHAFALAEVARRGFVEPAGDRAVHPAQRVDDAIARDQVDEFRLLQRDRQRFLHGARQRRVGGGVDQIADEHEVAGGNVARTGAGQRA